MDTDQCPICKRWFPDEPLPLVTDAFVDGEYRTMCPLCYCDFIRDSFGREWVPGEDSLAAEMLALAREFVKIGKTVYQNKYRM